jgi:hypothetical protein
LLGGTDASLLPARRPAKVDAEKPEGHFAPPHARLFITRQAGFENRAELVRALE